MRKLRSGAAAGLLAIGIGVLAVGLGAQSFQGGLRGVVKDPQGVIPGATVTLVNDQNGVSRETVTNGVGEYSFPAIEPALYTVRASVQGFKTFERKGVRIGTQEFIALDIQLEVGGLEETITVTGESPLDRHDQRLDRRRARHQVARIDSDAGPQRVPDGEPPADRPDQRQRALEPHAGSGRQLGRLDGRRSGAGEPVPRRRLPRHRSAEPRLDQSDDRSDPGHEGAGPHLRRRNGTHRRRRHEHDRQVRRQRFPRVWLHGVPSGEIRSAAADPEAAGTAQRAGVLAQRRRRWRRPDFQEQDVLLVRG